MKRVFLILLLAVGLAVWSSSGVLANGGPHGDYTATTDACAGCHRAHTAQGAKLLTAQSTYNLCISCHGSTGSGANTNVDDGQYLSSRDDASGNWNHGAANTPDNANLLGGGFTNYKGSQVTSSHDPTGTETAAWGYGVARGSTGNLTEGLDCASCHDPHGNNNYRILNESINGKTVSVTQVDEGNAKDYDTEQWVGTGLSSFCAACHGAYHVTRAGSGSNNADDGQNNTDYGGDISSYAHRVDMPYNYGGNANPETVGFQGSTLPLADDPNDPNAADTIVVCTTCHLPHGTSATMSSLATGPYTNDSALLRLDNRGVCEVCHQK